MDCSSENSSQDFTLNPVIGLEGSRDLGADSKSQSPIFAVSKDLRGDLDNILSRDFDFHGKTAFGTSLPTAPDPGLHVEPIGSINLPLSEQDAKRLKDVASQAPFGHGKQTVVDTRVRHTWEIDPANITFSNTSEWTSFMRKTIKTVCAELGVAPSTNPPSCVLHKLLIYEEGSHFLPHQDTEKAPGMFATMIIVLPSLYSGGEVCVAHGSEKQVLDFAESSGLETSLLAWYADVTHEVKPITLGYRLVLSYNLIYPKGSQPMHSLPPLDSSAARLKLILSNWSSKAYDDPPRIVAILLKHQYSSVDLSMGGNALKGADAHLVNILHNIAAKEGVGIGLAELEGHITGHAGEPWGYAKRARFDPYDEDDDEDKEEDEDEDEDMDDHFYDDSPTMAEETDRETSLSNLVDLDGEKFVLNGKISVSSEELIPSDPFDGEGPDDEKIEGYMGNESADIEYWYQRTAVFLYLKAETESVLLEAGGNAYAIAQLKQSNSSQPSARDHKFASYVAEHLNPDERERALFVSDLALSWGESKLWLTIASRCGISRNLKALGEDTLKNAWKSFGFEKLRPLFEQAVANCTTLKGQVELINSIPPLMQREDDRIAVLTWCNEEKASAFAHMKPPLKEDVPIITEVLKSRGLNFFTEILQPQLIRMRNTYEFLITLTRAMQSDIVESSESTYAGIADFCLTSAVKEWNKPKSSKTSIYDIGLPVCPSVGQSLGRVKEIAELCVLTAQMAPCDRLFEILIADSTNLEFKYRDYFIPLIPDLHRILDSQNIPLDSQPFSDFFRYLIETYLALILSAKDEKKIHSAIRKVGCGCADCQELDGFLVSSEAQREFRYAQKRRSHLEYQLSNSSDIVKLTTDQTGRPYGLRVTKNTDVAAAAFWERRQKAAKRFLACFGGDAAIKKIMGANYSDVMKAISGEKPYSKVVKPFTSSTSNTTAPESQTMSLKTDDHIKDESSSIQIIAGRKRKIDLSGSP